LFVTVGSNLQAVQRSALTVPIGTCLEILRKDVRAAVRRLH
jgi:hypothetical protein